MGWCYTGLISGLPADLGVHAIQARGIGTGRPSPADDLTALARRQYETIRSLVGDQPFHVAGWSLGGMAAHAVATVARTAGHEVASVTLLDAYPPSQWQHLSEPTETEALTGILRLAGLDAPQSQAPLTRDQVADLLRASGSALASLPPRVLDGCLRSVLEAARLVRTDTPGIMPGDLTLIVAGAPRPETHVDPAGWHNHVAGEVNIVTLSVTHGELVRAPAVSAVAQVLAEAVRR